jgi:hypothetical protein
VPGVALVALADVDQLGTVLGDQLRGTRRRQLERQLSHGGNRSDEIASRPLAQRHSALQDGGEKFRLPTLLGCAATTQLNRLYAPVVQEAGGTNSAGANHLHGGVARLFPREPDS